jgi:hypothetical protein
MDVTMRVGLLLLLATTGLRREAPHQVPDRPRATGTHLLGVPWQITMATEKAIRPIEGEVLRATPEWTLMQPGLNTTKRVAVTTIRNTMSVLPLQVLTVMLTMTVARLLLRLTKKICIMARVEILMECGLKQARRRL